MGKIWAPSPPPPVRYPNDPTETQDLARAHPEIAARLRGRLDALRASVYAPDRGPIEQAACDVLGSRYHGFWGPWQDI